jgi:polar amino acid transport system substrate-binding protein
MKSAILTLTAILLVSMSLLSSCTKANLPGDTQGPKKENVLDRVQRTGILRVGYFVFEPATMHDKDGKPYGLFVDVVEQIAADLRWKVEYKQVDLKNFAASLQSGEFDLSIGATFSSPSRASGVMFTRPLFYLGYTGVTTAGKVQQFKTWLDIDKQGVRVAVKQGSAIGDYVTRNFKNATVISLEQAGLSAPLAAVPAQADVGLMNQGTIFAYLRDNPQSGLVEILRDNPVEFTGACWAVAPDEQRFLEFINTALKHYEDTGRFKEWESKYKIPYLYRELRTYGFDIGSSKGTIQK